MVIHPRPHPYLGVGLTILIGLAAVGLAQTVEASEGTDCPPVQGEATPLAAAKLYIEFNATDDDIGVHGAFDGPGFAELCVYDPAGTPVLAIKPQGQLKDLAIGGIFFESREPPGAEYSYEDLMGDFPDGEYQARGVSFEGGSLTGTAIFSHDVPAPPTVTAPLEDAVVPPDGLVVTWEPVTRTTTGAPVTITAYEVIVTKEVDDDPNGFSRPTFDVHVPPDRNSLSVPAEFLEPDSEYELEVLALEESGNQTITVVFFRTE